jgi:uncharacterized protein HemY
MRLRAFRFLSERYDCPRGGATAESLIRGYSHGKVPRVVLKADLSSTVPLLLVALLFFVLLAIVGIVLLSIALRYRAGTARRRGRRWVAAAGAGSLPLTCG